MNSIDVRRKHLLRLAILFIAVFLGGCVLLASGCAAGKYSAANVNQTVTTVIADAGTVAIQAEQDYAAGKIPQTNGTRAAINDLGAAYEQAKKLFNLVLTAEAVYNANEAAQVASCQPASSQGGVVPDPAKCSSATQAAAAAKVGLDTAQANLSASLSTLSAKTSTVRALPRQ